MPRFNRDYRYDMGFAINGSPIPDPATYGGSESALDTSAERDATGYLHRTMVATKHTFKMGWKNITWDMTQSILKKVSPAKFEFTVPDPADGRAKTYECYAGDRSWECVWSPGGEDSIGNLSFNVIEY